MFREKFVYIFLFLYCLISGFGIRAIAASQSGGRAPQSQLWGGGPGGPIPP